MPSFNTRFKFFKADNYCARHSLYEQSIPNDTSITAISQNRGIHQLKSKKGGTRQTVKLSINQYGRYKGCSGKQLSNF